MTYRIAFIPGDGIGPETASQASEVLLAVTETHNISIDIKWMDWGCDYYLEHGRMMPENALEILSGFDAIFLGSIGNAAKVADHISLDMLLTIRRQFDQYVNLRPISLYAGVDTVIRTATPETVNFVVVRENTEGEYADVGGFSHRDQDCGTALQTSVFTRKGCERIHRYAFKLAADRAAAAGRSGTLTNCTKSNALKYSNVFWDDIFHEVSEEFAEVGTRRMLVDAMAMALIRNPAEFDVIVATNLYGDIITDLASMLQGGMGFAAGGNINPEKQFPSMFEPIHGSAPDIAGQGIANPIASIEAVRMMLQHLGLKECAEEVYRAIAVVLRDGRVKTRDMGGCNSTKEMGAAVLNALGGPHI